MYKQNLEAAATPPNILNYCTLQSLVMVTTVLSNFRSEGISTGFTHIHTYEAAMVVEFNVYQAKDDWFKRLNSK